MTWPLFSGHGVVTQIIYTYNAVYIPRKMFCWNSTNNFHGFQQPDLNPVHHAVYEGICSKACIGLKLLAWTISKTQCTPAERILTNRSSTNLLITGVTNWRLWFDWMVDTLNSGFDYLVHLRRCSVRGIYVLKHSSTLPLCIKRTMVLFQKVI